LHPLEVAFGQLTAKKHIPSHFVVPLCIPADCLDLSVRCLHRNTFAYEA